VPTAAPVTGGGGTAGFQNAMLLAAGLAAIVAGAGSIFYWRRVNRGR
jgi:LPXTG-motif cell wall-anchored protein